VRPREVLDPLPNPDIVWGRARAHACIPVRAWDADLRLIPDTAPYKTRIFDYIAKMHELEKAGFGLILYGEQGTGKTTIAVQVMKEAMARGAVRGYFVEAAEIPKLAIRRPDTAYDESVWDQLRGSAQFLVIDDLGSESEESSFWDDRTIREILSSRYNNALPTLITANLSLATLYERVPRLGKIAGDCYATIEVSEPKWRAPAQVV